MKKGEQLVWGSAVLVTLAAFYAGYVVYKAPPKLMPTYQEESPAASRGELIYRQNFCSSCHAIWNVGGGKGGELDGIGSRRSAEWLAKYLAADDPQLILPSTQKKVYQMPSFASLPKAERDDLVAYLVSLKQRSDEEVAPHE